MKYLIILLLFLFQLSSNGQNKNEPLPDLDIKNWNEKQIDSSIYTIVQIPASFPGGPNAMKDFISSKTKTIEPKLTGTVVFRVVVEINGTLTHLTLVKNSTNCADCEKEARKIISLMPNWTAAEFNDNTVRSYFNIPVKLDSQ